MAKTLITAGWVLPVGTPPIKDGCVEISEGRFTYVGPIRDYPESECELIEYSRGIILPGLVNAHTHLAYSLFRNRVTHSNPLDALLCIGELKHLMSADDLLKSVHIGSMECIRAGITTIANIVDLRHPEIAQVTANHGLRTVALLSVRDRDEIQEIDQILKKILDHQPKAEVFRVGISPHSLYLVGPKRLRELAAYAEKTAVPISIHLAELSEEAAFFKRAIRSTWVGEKLFRFYNKDRDRLRSPTLAAAECRVLSPTTIAVHCIFVDDQDLNVLKAAGVSVCLCPRSNEQMGNSLPPLNAMVSKNLNLCLGTDSAATCKTYDMFEEMRLLFRAGKASTIDGGLTGADLLRIATINGARALGLESVIGTLEVGKRADLVVVDIGDSRASDFKDPCERVVVSCRPSDVELTMVDGKPIWERPTPKVDFRSPV